MPNHIRWVLRQEHPNCPAYIPVPVPKQTGTIEDPLGIPKDVTEAAFLCSECGFATLYSQLHLDRDIGGTLDPYLENRLALVYLEVGCVSNCGSLTKIHAVLDVATGNFAAKKPMQQWVFDERVTCECGLPLLFYPAEFQSRYSAEMPF